MVHPVLETKVKSRFRTELMGLRVRDVTIHEKDDRYLIMKLNWKNGYRESVSLPVAVNIFKRQVARANLQADDYLWFSSIENRQYANTKFSRKFTEMLKKHGFRYDADGEKRSVYSLRHFGISTRLQSSGGEINIYSLAKNAGTSVKMLEDFYLKYMKPNRKMIENLLYFHRE